MSIYAAGFSKYSDISIPIDIQLSILDELSIGIFVPVLPDSVNWVRVIPKCLPICFVGLMGAAEAWYALCPLAVAELSSVSSSIFHLILTENARSVGV